MSVAPVVTTGANKAVAGHPLNYETRRLIGGVFVYSAAVAAPAYELEIRTLLTSFNARSE
jgi:hypothetical protein